ncbi:hypothetical protein [Mesorhizobium amorphae]|uniref:hypothetical protein n=1 Tax=Mesorhizobium amorphae TaxID=71433 RepID=UPI00177EC6A3|nr:hypothetical protein [Mesorhizobium amorphae]
MPSVTDPARELADVFERLSPGAKGRGDDHLASQFGVAAWSTNFYQIVFCITERSDALMEIIAGLEMDDDLKNDARRHLKDIRQAFARDSLSKSWQDVGAKHLRRENVQPIKMLSPYVRQKIFYPKLDDEEVKELLELLAKLQDWLEKQQLAEQDFVRQAILESIRNVRFRLERIGWLGWGYTVSSIREVIGAYLALESGLPDVAVAPDAEAVLKKVRAFLKTFYEKTGTMKDVVDTGDFLLKAYGAASLVYHGAGIAGLLTYAGISP